MYSDNQHLRTHKINDGISKDKRLASSKREFREKRQRKRSKDLSSSPRSEERK